VRDLMEWIGIAMGWKVAQRHLEARGLRGEEVDQILTGHLHARQFARTWRNTSSAVV
jgi:hypothetical protein